MPRAIYVASGSAGVQPLTGAATVLGFSVRENAGTPAAASITIRNGASSSAPAIAVINLSAGSSQTADIPAIDCLSGIFVDRISGTTELVVYVL